MARPYTINIVNGTASEAIVSGNYTATGSINGYVNNTLDPASIVVTNSSGTFDFKVSATGTLTLHVSVEGTSGGTSIVGATFVRCDSAGNTYGTPIVSDSSGTALFTNVPFSATTPPTIFYKQTDSDGNHNFDGGLKNTSLTTNTGTVEISNPLPGSQTINLTDANYTNLPIEDGTLTLS